MNLFHLRYFVQLAHTRHYTRAAEALCITQPSLSHAIGQLEAELGVPLFEKTGRNTTLTHFGEEFLTCVESALATLDAGVETMRRSARGRASFAWACCGRWGWSMFPGWRRIFWPPIPGGTSTLPSIPV